jgi:hypothetical protein
MTIGLNYKDGFSSWKNEMKHAQNQHKTNGLNKLSVSYLLFITFYWWSILFILFCFKSLDQRVTFRLRQMTLNWVEKRPRRKSSKQRTRQKDRQLFVTYRENGQSKQKNTIVRLSEKSGCNQWKCHFDLPNNLLEQPLKLQVQYKHTAMTNFIVIRSNKVILDCLQKWKLFWYIKIW